jgi:hypothetical protein
MGIYYLFVCLLWKISINVHILEVLRQFFEGQTQWENVQISSQNEKTKVF